MSEWCGHQVRRPHHSSLSLSEQSHPVREREREREREGEGLVREGMRGLAETETEAEAVLGLSESVSVLRVLLAATAVLVSVLLVWRRQKLKQRRRAARHVQDPRYCTFPLMQSECMGLERTGSVSTLTVFEGDCAAAEVWVRRRTLEVIRANPWLTGRLLSSVNRHSPFRVCHRKEVTAEDANNHVLTLDDPLLDARNLDQAIKSHANHLVRRGIDCIDTDQQLFKIIFSRVSADSFALVLSLSHMLGDGSTYYKIFSMFSNKENVIALKAERNEELQRKSFHMSRAPDLFGSFLFKLRMISFALQPKTASRAFIADVDQMWIIEEKKTHKKMIKNDASNHFVSTNDLLVSWFANIVGLDFLLMAMDSRGRSPVMKVRTLCRMSLIMLFFNCCYCLHRMTHTIGLGII